MQNWNPEKILYFIDARQQLHLKQVFTISKMAGWVEQNPPAVGIPLDKGDLKEGDSCELFHAYN
jgi:arginyl-tRNA synthetase